MVAGHQVCNELDQGWQGDIATDMTDTSNLDGYRAGSLSA
nr:DUF732 domain-containing protein [Mycobacterium gastri]